MTTMTPRTTLPKAALWPLFLLSLTMLLLAGCDRRGSRDMPGLDPDAANNVYVAPGQHDELYGFFSGGFSGQVSVVGLPSGRTLKVLPVFSQNGENGYGYSEETKPLLNTSYGFIP